MKITREYDYQHNEWVVIYVDDCGDRQLIYFDLFKQANEFLTRIQKNGACVIGITTTAFAEHCIK